MMVTFVSQCQKNALKKTRRVLDAFADRIGDNTWQTVITQEGLRAVRKLLRQTASKNTAVSCHWIRTRSRSELVWVVGKKEKFDMQGRVPVNFTEDHHAVEESFSLNNHIIALFAKLAGYFHDIGKSSTLFQAKLEPNHKGKRYEPYGHEWVSLRIFQAFVGKRSDKEWLEELSEVDNSTEQEVLERIKPLQDGLVKNPANPFKHLPPIAKLVAWLIVSHHKLPQYPRTQDTPPPLEYIDSWLEISFEACWISPQCLKDWEKNIVEKNWEFSYGTLFKSVHWQTQVSVTARSILRCERMFIQSWFEQHFTAHLARLCLVLSDHYYSSQKVTTPEWQDRNYKAYANTDKDEQGKKYKKQKLDEHNIAVGIYAFDIAKRLPKLKNDLPSSNPIKYLQLMFQ